MNWHTRFSAPTKVGPNAFYAVNNAADSMRCRSARAHAISAAVMAGPDCALPLALLLPALASHSCSAARKSSAPSAGRPSQHVAAARRTSATHSICANVGGAVAAEDAATDADADAEECAPAMSSTDADTGAEKADAEEADADAEDVDAAAISSSARLQSATHAPQSPSARCAAARLSHGAGSDGAAATRRAKAASASAKRPAAK